MRRNCAASANTRCRTSAPGTSPRHARRQRIRADADRAGYERDDGDRHAPAAAREPWLQQPQDGELGKQMRLDESSESCPFGQDERKPRLARERDRERRAVDRDEDAQDRAEITQIRQHRRSRGLPYNPLHKGREMQASCRTRIIRRTARSGDALRAMKA
jgi:hypothetical protein